MKINKYNFQDKKYSVYIKGICAIIIMLYHYLSKTEIHPIIKFLLNGTICVSIFFFYSGFGLSYSLKNKKEYLNHFIKKKIISLYIPYCIANLVCYFSKVITKNSEINIITLLLVSFGIKLSNDILWYMIHLIICNLLFYTINKVHFLKKKNRLWYVVIYIVYILSAVLFDLPNWWYLSTSCFVLGLLIDDLNIIKKINKNLVKLLLVISGTIIFITLFLFEYNYISIQLIPKNYVVTLLYLLECPLIVITLYYFKHIITDRIENILLSIGNISMEIYLFHIPISILIEKFFINNIAVKNICKVLITILIASIINKLKKEISNGKNKRNNSHI